MTQLELAKGVKGVAQRDRKMSLARKRFDWQEQAELSLDPQRFNRVHAKHETVGKACSMCGDFCAMDLAEKYLGISVARC